MGTMIIFPDRVFDGKRYFFDSVFLSKKSALSQAEKLRGIGWFARIAVASKDAKGKRRVGYIGVYKSGKTGRKR
jgi:hypothetical protein